MENYTKGDTKKVYNPPSLTMDGAIEMKVNSSSKIRNLMGFAISSISEEKVRHITWNGTGQAINKTISCAEIMKRKIKGLHQISQIGYMMVEDYWEPKVDGLEMLKVNTNVPTISILLSKDPLDKNNPSYQAPGSSDLTWSGSSKRKPSTRSQKKHAAIKDIKTAASKPHRSRGNRKEGKNSASKRKLEESSAAAADVS